MNITEAVIAVIGLWTVAGVIRTLVMARVAKDLINKVVDLPEAFVSSMGIDKDGHLSIYANKPGIITITKKKIFQLYGIQDTNKG